MANWIRCNKCVRPFDGSIQFFVAECGHLECQNCLKAGDPNGNLCSICNKACKRMLLSKDMRPDVQIYFKPFSFVMDQLKKTYEFQEKQREVLLRQLMDKYTYAKKEVLKCQKVIESQRRDISKLKGILKYNQTPNDGNRQGMSSAKLFQTSTPMSKASLGMDLSLSTLQENPFTPRSAKPGYVRKMPISANTAQNQSFLTGTPSSAQVVPSSRSSSAARMHFSRIGPTVHGLSPLVQFPTIHRPRPN